MQPCFLPDGYMRRVRLAHQELLSDEIGSQTQKAKSQNRIECRATDADAMQKSKSRTHKSKRRTPNGERP